MWWDHFLISMFYLVFIGWDTLQKTFLPPLTAGLGNMMKTARRWLWSLLVYWLVKRRLLKPALHPLSFTSLRIKQTWLPGMLGNPLKSINRSLSHVLHLLSEREASGLYLHYWLQSLNQQTGSELQYDASWAGKHRPPPPPLHSVREVFITTTSYIPFKVTRSLGERD